eukprot:UN24152
MVGSGLCRKEETRKPMADLLPRDATWRQNKVKTFDPESNQVVLDNGETISYKSLVVAMGNQTNWSNIEGLDANENLGKNGLVSIYDYEQAENTYNEIKNFKGGKAVFTFTPTPKCPGAPQKIMYLADSIWRENNALKNNFNVMWYTSLPKMFGAPKYNDALVEVVKQKGIQPFYSHNLKKINSDRKVAWFASGDKLVE